MEEQKEYKATNQSNSIKEVKMGIFGRGKGFLGLSVRCEALHPKGSPFGRVAFGEWSFISSAII